MDTARLHPTRSLGSRLRDHDTSWRDVVADLSGPTTVVPTPGSETRRAVIGTRFTAFVEPAPQVAPGAFMVVGVRERSEEERTAREWATLGREKPAPKSSRSGGKGRRWPTTFKDLERRCRAKGAKIIPGRHRKVVWDNEQVILPSTSGDHRAVVNAAQELRRHGLDVTSEAPVDPPAED